METAPSTLPARDRGLRVLLLGATGTIGRAVLDTLHADGHRVTCFGRSAGSGPPGTDWRRGSVTDPASIRGDGLRGERFDAVISCLASRTGVPADARAIDHRAHSALLEAACEVQTPRFIQLSAICVQKPRLAFQHAKLAFETELMAAPIDWTIIRPTAFFKSLSGQLARLKAGKPYLVFGDGTLTSCKPISDRDLARFIAGCLTDPGSVRAILPIGGPGPALTPRDIGHALFERLGKRPRFASMPVAAMRLIAGGLGAAGTVAPPLRRQAELARIGLYYGTESMLVWDAAAGRYDAAATPETGQDTLFEHFDALVEGRAEAERGAHAVF